MAQYSKPKLLASYSSLENAQKGLSEYFYSPNIKLIPSSIDGIWDIHNAIGKIDRMNIRLHRGRYRFELREG